MQSLTPHYLLHTHGSCYHLSSSFPSGKDSTPMNAGCQLRGGMFAIKEAITKQCWPEDTKSYWKRARSKSEDVLELTLLLGSKGGRELDVDANYKVSTLAGLLALGHSQAREFLLPCWSSWSSVSDRNLLSFDGLDGSVPANQSFLQIDFNSVSDVVAVALEERVWFLYNVSSHLDSRRKIQLTSSTMKWRS
jgi:hypothetical protein